VKSTVFIVWLKVSTKVTHAEKFANFSALHNAYERT